MKHLPDVTVVAITTRDYGYTATSIKKTLQHIKPHSVLFFSDIKFNDPDYECVIIPKMDWKQYNEFVCKELWRYVTTNHMLLIQWDGHVIDSSAWTDEFLDYDYIGAPWTYKDGRNVGNGGFSMRSKRLMEIMATDEMIAKNGIYAPEDEVICRLYRRYLEETYKISFAPEELAHQFSYEMHPPAMSTFGFHANFHEPYKEFIILQRVNCGMGDIIMLEPVMEHLHKNNYRVVLDILVDYFHLFQYHQYPVLHISQISHAEGVRLINLDMAYESKPQQLVLKSYYEFCGIENGVLRNSKLNFPVDGTTKLFEKYIVMHVDDTDMPYRNVHGVNWFPIAKMLESQGYLVIQVGREKKMPVKMNTPTKNMLMYLIAGADYFIGVDSGPSQIAVALGVKSIIFFGSVNPDYRYPDLSKIKVIQNNCDQAGCYHSVIGVRGTDCVYDVKNPPCTTHITGKIMTLIENLLNSF